MQGARDVLFVANTSKCRLNTALQDLVHIQLVMAMFGSEPRFEPELLSGLVQSLTNHLN